jgi:hypothetical protein
VQVTDRSVELQLLVEIVEVDMGQLMVSVKPVVAQYLEGSPQPRPLAEDDPNMPPWVHGRVDTLQMAIYNNAKGMVAKP